MARRKKMVAGRKLLSPRALLGEESRASVAVTVAWMLTILTTGLALLGSAVAFGAAQSTDFSPQLQRILAILSRIFLLTAVLTGFFCLILTAAVHRVRQDRPPLAITLLAVVLGVLPLALVLLLL